MDPKPGFDWLDLALYQQQAAQPDLRALDLALGNLLWQEFPLSTELALRLRLQSDELISTNPNSQLVDGRSPGWVTLDATVNYHWRPQTTLFAAVTNALDRQRDFADANDFSPETGRLIRLGLRHDFGAAREPI